MPSLELTLIQFVTHLAAANISHTIIKVYVSLSYLPYAYHCWHAQFLQWATNTSTSASYTQHQKVSSTDHPTESQATNHPRKNVEHQADIIRSTSNIMLWAACCLAFFFWFLRVSEFTVPCHTDYDPSLYLSLQDISIDNRDWLLGSYGGHPAVPRTGYASISGKKRSMRRPSLPHWGWPRTHQAIFLHCYQFNQSSLSCKLITTSIIPTVSAYEQQTQQFKQIYPRHTSL